MNSQIRPAQLADLAQLNALTLEAFARRVEPAAPGTDPIAQAVAAGRHTWVAECDGQVVAKCVDLEASSWFGGNLVPTCGIAGVAIASEYRGRGLLRPLLTTALTAAVERGAAISTLYPTAAQIYRRLGYELFASLDTMELATSDLCLRSSRDAPLAAVAEAPGSRGHRVSEADWPQLTDVYRQWAQARNGPLVRIGPFQEDPAESLAAATGITMVRDDDGVATGYAVWTRAGGYHPAGLLEVEEFVTLTPTAARLLLATLSSHSPVVSRTRICATRELNLVLPRSAQTVDSRGCMLAILDVPAALAARGYPRWLTTTLEFEVHGLPVIGQDGAYRLSISNGSASCERIAAAARQFSAAGLALTFAGAHPSATLRAAGYLHGENQLDEWWDACFGGRVAAVSDYF